MAAGASGAGHVSERVGDPPAQPIEPPDPVPAVMCVEVVRACGLLAAVNEAAIWLGGGESAFVDLSMHWRASRPHLPS